MLYQILHRKTDVGAKNSDATVGGLQQVFKPRFTKLIKVHRFCGIVYWIFCCLLGIQFLEFQVEFKNLLPQFGLPNLLEDVIGKYPNKC